MTETYVTIVGRAVGSDRDGFRVTFGWDRKQFIAKEEAVSNGFELYGCDDFNVGVVRDGKLVSLWWMDHQLRQSDGTLARISQEIGL